MSGPFPCHPEDCAVCHGIVVRVYRTLVRTGYDDAQAFRAAVRVLSLRHPGHAADYYFRVAAEWLAPEPDASPEPPH